VSYKPDFLKEAYMTRRKQCYSGIGGQAVLEGIMMKNGDKYAVAVRKSDGTIDVQVMDYKSALPKNWFTTLPFVRGTVNFIDSLAMGMKCLSSSADVGMEDAQEEPGKFEKWMTEKFGDKAGDILMTFTMIIAIFLAIGLFMVLPYAISALMGIWIHNKMILSLAEAVVRLAIFLSYVILIGQMDDIRRLYMYHGAEHKCINCIERGWMLNENSVMRSSRLHPRCGTSFLLYVMIISCIMFFFINVSDPILRLIIRLVLVPVIAGIAYELIRLAGRFDNYFTRVMSVPGMLVQKITTKEPTPEMIEVAIKAVEAVFDWEEFQKRAFGYDDSEEYIFEEDAAEYDEDVLEETFHQIPKEELEESPAEEAIVQEQKDDI
jgi:uncharacterized protein YqhQ